ncbi:hypothetical protein EVG20_g759 [Dentipellis fragilis]|uniref:Small nuclear ribonucleoprotein E n=1 Tax=Dentipellis fragilis TaxID=205917 RepID=A0A4Y9ZBM2_9AGAM|nr:hypothetical protein EVG20_g759 [Dentipellis fragilis]
MSGRQQRVMVQPINVIFKNLQQRAKVVIWLYDNIEMRIEGRIIVRASPFWTLPSLNSHPRRDDPLHYCGHAAPSLPLRQAIAAGFDEFMNLVIDEAAEVFVKDAKPRRELGRIMLKGDTITLIQQIV